MRFFNNESEEDMEQIFYKKPSYFTKYTDRNWLAYCIGAALYMPATREKIAEDLLNNKFPELTSIIIDLEDAVGDNQIEQALHNLDKNITTLFQALSLNTLHYEQLPLLFIRVRNPKQLAEVISLIGEKQSVLTGYVFPKFSASNGLEFFQLLKAQNDLGYRLYGMPILESDEVIFKERRFESLLAIRELLIEYYDYVLNVRIGTTDFCGLFGIRRKVDTTIYDVVIIRDCIADIINILNRTEHHFVISGPVWEYFSHEDRILRPKLRESPFQRRYGKAGIERRKQLISDYIDGLINEVLLDQLNGIVGKTIIHPTHIQTVNALYVVTHEEYIDALAIMENSNGQIGVKKSEYQNKMNEIKPHLNWAERILKRASIYGVYNPKEDYTSLILK